MKIFLFQSNILLLFFSYFLFLNYKPSRWHSPPCSFSFPAQKTFRITALPTTFNPFSKQSLLFILLNHRDNREKIEITEERIPNPTNGNPDASGVNG
jgi:hypothetical protein